MRAGRIDLTGKVLCEPVEVEARLVGQWGKRSEHEQAAPTVEISQDRLVTRVEALEHRCAQHTPARSSFEQLATTRGDLVEPAADGPVRTIHMQLDIGRHPVRPDELEAHRTNFL